MQNEDSLSEQPGVASQEEVDENREPNLKYIEKLNQNDNGMMTQFSKRNDAKILEAWNI